MIFCLLADSPPIDAAEQQEIDRRDLAVAREGRRPGLKIVTGGRERPLARARRRARRGGRRDRGAARRHGRGLRRRGRARARRRFAIPRRRRRPAFCATSSASARRFSNTRSRSRAAITTISWSSASAPSRSGGSTSLPRDRSRTRRRSSASGHNRSTTTCGNTSRRSERAGSRRVGTLGGRSALGWTHPARHAARKPSAAPGRRGARGVGCGPADGRGSRLESVIPLTARSAVRGPILAAL